MALRHMAWFRFKDGVTIERIEEHLSACRSVVGRVPGGLESRVRPEPQ
jgi:hypothetical protein